MTLSLRSSPLSFFPFGLVGAATLLAGLFSGVRSEVKLVGPKLPPRPPSCDVQIFEEEKSQRPHETVAEIDVYVRRNKVTQGRRGVFEEAVPELKKQACKVGADAVVVLRQVVSHSGEFKILYVKTIAIHFIENSSPRS